MDALDPDHPNEYDNRACQPNHPHDLCPRSFHELAGDGRGHQPCEVGQLEVGDVRAVVDLVEEILSPGGLLGQD
jgi:hypothetical protein